MRFRRNHQLRCSRSQSRLHAREYLERICRAAYTTSEDTADQRSGLPFLRLPALAVVGRGRTSCGLSADCDLRAWPTASAQPHCRRVKIKVYVKHVSGAKPIVHKQGTITAVIPPRPPPAPAVMMSQPAA